MPKTDKLWATVAVVQSWKGMGYVVTCVLIIAGGELALEICSATLGPPATDGSHPKMLNLFFGLLVIKHLFLGTVVLDTAHIEC